MAIVQLEYLIVNIEKAAPIKEVEACLNAYGTVGWEHYLKADSPSDPNIERYYFKRQKQ